MPVARIGFAAVLGLLLVGSTALGQISLVGAPQLLDYRHLQPLPPVQQQVVTPEVPALFPQEPALPIYAEQFSRQNHAVGTVADGQQSGQFAEPLGSGEAIGQFYPEREEAWYQPAPVVPPVGTPLTNALPQDGIPQTDREEMPLSEPQASTVHSPLENEFLPPLTIPDEMPQDSEVSPAFPSEGEPSLGDAPTGEVPHGLTDPNLSGDMLEEPLTGVGPAEEEPAVPGGSDGSNLIERLLVEGAFGNRPEKPATDKRKKGQQKKEEAAREEIVVDEEPTFFGRLFASPADGCAACGSCGSGMLGCSEPACTRWYVRGTGLVLGRDQADRVWVSYESGNNANQIMNTQDTGDEWQGGGEIRFGRYFGCRRWAVEAAYWSIANFDTFASVSHPNFVSTPLSFLEVVYADPAIPGLPQDLFESAQEHRLWRENELHNVELNLVRFGGQNWCAGQLGYDWFVGVRFFRFTEDLTFGSLRQGAAGWGIDPADEGYLYDRVENNLVGPQLGCRLRYFVGPRWSINLTPVVGVYGNHIKHHFAAYRGDGEWFDTVPANYPGYPVDADETVVSFLSQIDLGVEWRIAERWTAEVGYRVLVASRVALADDQIPFYVVDTPELADIEHNGDLLLHGAYIGVNWQF